MRKLSGIIAILSALLATPALAGQSEFQIMPRAGRGEINVSRSYNVNNEDVDLDTFGLGVGIAFLTPIGVLVEIGHEDFATYDWFNADADYDLEQSYAALGYQFELDGGWRIVPKVGRARWDVTSKEGQFLHPGPEDSLKVRGYENFWELGFGKRISDVITLGGAARGANYDFGNAASLSFVMTIGFH